MSCRFQGSSKRQKKLWGESLYRILITEPMRTEKLFNRKPSDLLQLKQEAFACQEEKPYITAE